VYGAFSILTKQHRTVGLVKDFEGSSYGLNPKIDRKEINQNTHCHGRDSVYLKNASLECHRYANLLSCMSRFEDGGGTDLETLDVSDIL
jgi:hypothetical protein